MKRTTYTINQAFIDQACAQLRGNGRIRYALAHGGLLNIERQLPFLCVYRRPVDRSDEETPRLIKGEASYLVVTGAPSQRRRVAAMVEEIGHVLSAGFGSFLLLEIWAGAEVEEDEATDPEAMRPMFRIHVPASNNDGLDPTCDALAAGLKKISVLKKRADVEIIYARKIAPPGLSSVLPPTRMKDLHCFTLGVEVQPIYRSVQASDTFPLVLRALHRGVSLALKHTFFEFTRTLTTQRPRHFHVFGQRTVTKSMWEIDRRLEEISSSFDFLLQVTPVNISAGWLKFKRSGFRKPPAFHYRPLPVDPPLLKRRLYSINLDRVEDPSLATLFRDKRGELDRQLTMLVERGTRNFLLGSQQLYGPVDSQLRQTAEDILDRFSSPGRDDTFTGKANAEDFAKRARQELAKYRKLLRTVDSRVRVSDEVSGLICSRGDLLVGSNVRIPKNRVEGLIQHEVGTHLLTYINGKSQPFRLLSAGLAGYDELQEGVAVFSEYLVGQLSPARLRLLAGRVVAASYIEGGANFIETFRRLEHTHGFEQRTAYRITTRIYRGGGLTKDAIYLRGLVLLLKYLGEGGDLKILYTGKMAIGHISIVRELLHRGILIPPPLEPTYLSDPQAKKRLAAAASGLNVAQLVHLDEWRPRKKEETHHEEKIS